MKCRVTMLMWISALAVPSVALAAEPPPPAAPAVVSSPSIPAAPTTAPAASGGPEILSLRLMREKGILSEPEYESALRDLRETSGARASDGSTLVIGKWATTMYGFVEADHIWDSTESFNDLAGNAQVARPGTYAGDNGRVMFGVRNSRIGFRLKAPESNGIRTSAMLEMDFLGTQLPVGSGQPYFGSEGAFFTNPTFRVRHFNFKVETPIVDILVGQYWQLLGWQSVYEANTVQIQGLPGQLYGRTPQIRVSKTLKTKPVTVEVALAATRPFQRDSALPEGQGGVRIAFNDWTGMQTMGSTGTTISPASIALTGSVRQVSLPEFSATPKKSNEKLASGVAIDAFIPVLPATKDKKGNALSLTGELATGFGTADMYTGLTGGISFPALPNPTGATPAPTYAPNIDPGVAVYDPTGGLHYIQWTTSIVGAQYYLPGTDGRLWISANYSYSRSHNMSDYGVPAKARAREDWFDVNFFADVTPAVRVGLEYANFNDTYVDGTTAINHRVQASGFYLF